MTEFIMPEVREGLWIKINGDKGALIIPAKGTGKAAYEHYEGLISSFERVEGFGARMTDTDFREGTPWVVFPTKSEARAHLAELFDRCPICLAAMAKIDDKMICTGDHDG